MHSESPHSTGLLQEKLVKFLTLQKIKFKKIEGYVTAFIHLSYSKKHDNIDNYEKLEFFGDAVIGLVVTELLYLKSSLVSVSLGELSRRKHFLVSESVLSQVANNLSFSRLILIDKSSTNLKQQSLQSNTSILSDVFEAFIGALYLDVGLRTTKKFIFNHLFKPFHLQSLDRVDYPSLLQELTQKDSKTTPQYSFHKVDHDFVAHCQYNNLSVSVKGKNKKIARSKAAKLMLAKLK